MWSRYPQSLIRSRTPEGALVDFAPAVGAGLAEPRGELGSSLGRVPVLILVGVTADTFPETMVHLPRRLYCYSGQLLYCNGL
jgi:hypothetical protein